MLEITELPQTHSPIEIFFLILFIITHYTSTNIAPSVNDDNNNNINNILTLIIAEFLSSCLL